MFWGNTNVNSIAKFFWDWLVCAEVRINFVINFLFYKIYFIIRFTAFDVPDFESHTKEFEERYENLLSIVGKDHPFIISNNSFSFFLFFIKFIFDYSNQVVSRVKCEDPVILENLSRHVIKDEGEGMILRKPKSVYENGRSTSLLKLKVWTNNNNNIIII